MFLHAWSGYKSIAFGHDEVRPVSNITNDSWGGFGISMIDALDTMLLMGLRDEVELSRKHIATLQFDKVVSCLQL
jgi:mannosyl-oligosaccharide alpha-1,2-mannosidase